MRSGYARLERGDDGGDRRCRNAARRSSWPGTPAPAACRSRSAREASCCSSMAGPRRPRIERSSAAARATASHNTLDSAGSPPPSSCATPAWSGSRRAAARTIPTTSPATVHEADGSVEFEASHDGYVERFGLVHTRMLKLDAAGCGSRADRLGRRQGLTCALPRTCRSPSISTCIRGAGRASARRRTAWN